MMRLIPTLYQILYIHIERRSGKNTRQGHRRYLMLWKHFRVVASESLKIQRSALFYLATIHPATH